IGRSLLREDDPKDRRRGVTELLHVPARYADALPHLSALALAESASAMKELGDTGSAAILVRELRTPYPGHPVLGWERLARLTPAPPPETQAPGGTASATARATQTHDTPLR